MTTFRLPDLGEGLQEAEIVSWHVAAGDHVTSDQPLVSVETEKAVVEIPSPFAGSVNALLAKTGDVVPVGAPLVEFADTDQPDTGTVVGEIPSEEQAAAAATATKAEQKIGRGSPKAAPAVRALAKELNVDLTNVTPTGHRGQLTKKDVELAAGAATSSGRGKPLRKVRRSMARNMARAHAEIAPATITDDADVGAWPNRKNVMVRLVRAVAAACRAEPALNAWYINKRQERILHDEINLGVAVDTSDGLFVPVLRDAGNLKPDEVIDILNGLINGVKDRTIEPEKLRGQTITLSNFGALAGRYASLVIVPPQVAILGAGRLGPHVVAVDGAPAVRNVLPLSLTFDHRVVTGGEAARFLSAAIDDLIAAD